MFGFIKKKIIGLLSACTAVCTVVRFGGSF